MATGTRFTQLVQETLASKDARSATSQLVIESVSKTTADSRVSHVTMESLAHRTAETRVSQILIEVLYKVGPPSTPNLFSVGGVVFAGPTSSTSVPVPTDCIVLAVEVEVHEPCPPFECITICLSPEQEFYG